MSYEDIAVTSPPSQRQPKMLAIMMVLAIVGLFAALTILHFPTEASAISDLRALLTALEMYHPPYSAPSAY